MMKVRVVLLALSLLSLISWTRSDQCDTIPWDAQYGPNPLAPHTGKVVLVALMKGYCAYCVRQASRLQRLKTRLSEMGYDEIEMIIVNGGENSSRELIDNLRNQVSFEVIQDAPNHYMFRDVFQGYKDDFIIYDRCGQRSFFIADPHSNLVRFPYTIRALMLAYMGNHFCHCSADPSRRRNIYNTMYGDAPSSTSNNNDAALHASFYNFMECPPNDIICQRIQRISRQAIAGIGRNNRHGRIQMNSFIDQSDFDIQTRARQGRFLQRRMGQRGSGILRGRGHNSRERFNRNRLTHRNMRRHRVSV